MKNFVQFQGKTYCIWKLSDLNNCDQSVTFFLFSNVYKEHWKNEVGVVIGLLNPSIMDKAEKVSALQVLTLLFWNRTLRSSDIAMVLSSVLWCIKFLTLP